MSVAALLDAVVNHPQPLEACFPGEPDGGWAAVRLAHPETVAADGRWRLPVHAFLVRTPATAILIDAGIGRAGTPASRTFGAVGTLPECLARIGVRPDALDAVLFTHLHQDHVGWLADPDSGALTFARARHLVCRAEWETAAAGATQGFASVEEPRGSLELIEFGELADGVEVVALPGHTRGHCGVVVSGADARLAVVGDAFNHPLQVTQPAIPSLADGDRARAVATRRGILERAMSGEWATLASAHLPGAYWSVAAD